MKRRRDFRLIPFLLVAVGCLALLKISGIVLDGGYLLIGEPQPKKLSWAQETLNFPVPGGKVDPVEVTGSVDAPKKRSWPRTSAKRGPRRSWRRRRRKCLPPSAPCWNGCRSGGRSWRRGPAKSTSARAC